MVGAATANLQERNMYGHKKNRQQIRLLV